MKRLLEIESKFSFRECLLPRFRANQGQPPFHQLVSLRTREFTDTYFDRGGVLQKNGLWVRERLVGGVKTFEAKSLVSGTFARSTFSETTDVPTILAQIQQHIPSARSDSHTPNFGLDILAQLTTTRQTYVADEKFTIVLDRTDFGHSVGEVELEVELKEGAQDDEKEKAKTAERAHGDIDGFLEKYRWFCQAGPVEGKLSAYFRLRGGRVGHEGEGEEGRKAMKS